MIRLESLKKEYSDHIVIPDLSLEIRSGEFLTLLGPSGCGKTTLLRMIAGFEQPTSGEIWLEEQRITDLPPYHRDMNMVFQHYALFPHMNVEENILFGLKMKKVPREEQYRRLEEVLKLTRLEELRSRKPSQLSGGQQQRVAIARAIVNKPKVLLLDEPLGALDYQLRKSLQEELKTLQRRLGITFVYVTHDQEEALTMSDRIAVMNAGRIEQLGTPQEIYQAPTSRFVATFVGENNLFDTEEGTLAVRPEQIVLYKFGEDTHLHRHTGMISDVVFLGGFVKIYVQISHTQQNVLALLPQKEAFRWEAGEEVGLGWRDEHGVKLSC